MYLLDLFFNMVQWFGIPTVLNADAEFQLRRVQIKCLSFASYTLKIPCTSHDYSSVVTKLELSYLAVRRYFHNISFLINIISCAIYSPSILSLVNFEVSTRSTH